MGARARRRRDRARTGRELGGPRRPPALGAWLGPLMLPLVILLSSVLGVIIGIILLKIRKENQAFAFGPYIAIAGWIALLWGASIMELYLGV